MINKFESIEELNEYYENQFAHLTEVADSVGLSAEEEMRTGLLKAYKNDLELVVYNDDFELKKKRTELKRERALIRQSNNFNKQCLRVTLKFNRQQNKKNLKDFIFNTKKDFNNPNKKCEEPVKE